MRNAYVFYSKMYESAITEIMRPIKMSINVSRVFAFLTEEFLLKRLWRYKCILGVMEVMSLAAEQWCISINLITACTSNFETAGAITEDCRIVRFRPIKSDFSYNNKNI